MGLGATPVQTSPRVFEHFLAPENPGREWGRMLVLHIQDAGEKNTLNNGRNILGARVAKDRFR